MHLFRGRKMPFRVVALVLLSLASGLSLAGEIAAHNLIQSYSRDDKVCKEAAALLTADKSCRSSDAINCSEEEMYSVLINGTHVRVFEEIATNEYNYTRVYRASGLSGSKFAILYVEEFQGDRRPRLVETWKIDSSELEKTLNLPPGPIPYEQWVKMKPLPPRETNAAAFAEMLSQGEKVADEWSPVLDIHGEPYAIERECSGVWAYGGYYACNKVIKLTVKKLIADKKTIPYCQFSNVKSK
jgi:hypothetical protein